MLGLIVFIFPYIRRYQKKDFKYWGGKKYFEINFIFCIVRLQPLNFLNLAGVCLHGQNLRFLFGGFC